MFTKVTGKTLLILVLFSLCCELALGQQRRGQSSAPNKPHPTNTGSKPASYDTQTAITKDGRMVILKSDGTWEYAKVDPTDTIQQNSTLSLEAALIFNSGDVKPVARTQFLLLDDEPGKLLKAAGIKTAEPLRPEDDETRQLVFDFVFAQRSVILPNYAAFLEAALPVIKPHIIQSAITDFSGQAQFKPVHAGTYYLLGYTEVSRSRAGWNLELTLKPGSQKVTLDNNNTFTLF
jgi:hypothetical protein